MKKTLTVLGVAVVFLLVACGPTAYISSSWKSPGADAAGFKKIVVLGMVADPDPSLRQKLEQHIAADLISLGYNAICSCDEFGAESFRGLTEAEALEKLKQGGVDGALTIVLLDRRRETYYAGEPGAAGQLPTFYRYYQDRFVGPPGGGYAVTNSKYFWESNLYDLSGGSLLYNARSRFFDPGSSEEMGHEYGLMIVRDMVKKEVLAAGK